MQQSQLSDDLVIEQTHVKPLNIIGKGSYGEVWSGTWSSTQVAIKKLSLAEAFTPEAIKILGREVEIIARLRHPNIVQIYGVCKISPTDMWLVMELANGGSLYDLLASDTIISWCDRWRIAKEAVLAVSYLHSKRVLHRDLKSPNFLIVKGGIKLCDFGMAGDIHNSSASRKASLFAKGRPLGTARWIAPEATPNTDEEPKLSEKSDVYSLGIVLWEIAARQIPFHNVSFDYQVLGMVKYGNQRPPIPTSCPEAYADVITKCWSPLAADRPRASEVLATLEAQVALQDPVNIADKKSMYFEVNKERLLECVQKENVRVLTQPPPFPPKSPPIDVPANVEIVRLHPPNTTKKEQHHMLLSEAYDAVLWRRISEYFTRFYGTHSTATVELTAIDVIFNSALEARFAAENSHFENKFAGLQEFKTSGLSNQQEHFLAHLSKSANLLANNNANPISAWHGTSSSKLDSICWYGLLNLSATDPGYIGKGIYLTQEPKYGEYYAEHVKVKEGGNFSLLLCWALLGRPYAVEKVKLGCPLQENHTSHYTLVRRKCISRSICELEGDFEALESVTTYLPIETGEEAQGDEIVLFNSAHILPRYIVHYSIAPAKNINKTWRYSTKLDTVPLSSHSFLAPVRSRGSDPPIPVALSTDTENRSNSSSSPISSATSSPATPPRPLLSALSLLYLGKEAREVTYSAPEANHTKTFKNSDINNEKSAKVLAIGTSRDILFKLCSHLDMDVSYLSGALMEYKYMILDSCVTETKALLDLARRMNVLLIEPNIEVLTLQLPPCPSLGQEAWYFYTFNHIKLLWEDPRIRNTYAALSANMHCKFISKIDQIMADSHKPTMADIFYSTNCLAVQCYFIYRDIKITVVVLPEIPEILNMTKYSHLFENVTSLLFCIDFKNYKQRSETGGYILQESLEKLTAVANTYATPIGMLFANSAELENPKFRKDECFPGYVPRDRFSPFDFVVQTITDGFKSSTEKKRRTIHTFLDSYYAYKVHTISFIGHIVALETLHQPKDKAPERKFF